MYQVSPLLIRQVEKLGLVSTCFVGGETKSDLNAIKGCVLYDHQVDGFSCKSNGRDKYTSRCPDVHDHLGSLVLNMQGQSPYLENRAFLLSSKRD